jgi:hypothetical protein
MTSEMITVPGNIATRLLTIYHMAFAWADRKIEAVQ